MKKMYEVNVHYDMVLPITVEAENEEEALSLAEKTAAFKENPQFECYGISSCVTDEYPTAEEGI